MNIFAINKEYNATGQIAIKTGKGRLFLGELDAEFYFSRAGITDYNTKKDIYDYVKGLKDLNLWDYTINTFLLNSGYNSNTSTVYDLKNKNYDGKIINYNQSEWTLSGLHLKSGYQAPDPSQSSGKSLIAHPKLPVLSGNCTFVMLGKTLVNGEGYGMGEWWQQCGRAGNDRSIWFCPDAYYSSSEMQFGSNYYEDNLENSLPNYPFYWASAGRSVQYTATRLSTGQQYNIISYSNPYSPSTIPNSGTGCITVYKDGKFIAQTVSGEVTLPIICEYMPSRYPCELYSGMIGGNFGLLYTSADYSKGIGVKNDGFYTIAASFSKVLNSGEHIALHKLIKSTISKNIDIVL
jgi:hypothetical protein